MTNSSSEMLERLYGWLPRNYRDMDAQNNFQLKNFLDVAVSGGLFPVYQDTKNLLTLNDYDKIDTKYLPYLASSLGFQFPYNLDEQTQRTYIKNAVISYKIKGTKPALEFMIRELTRFKTTVATDDPNKGLTVTLEVDMDRQDYENVVDKVGFLVTEYAPPYKSYTLINTYLWEEPRYYFQRMDEDVNDTISSPASDISQNYDGWFLTNTSLLNQDELASGEIYLTDEVVEEVLSNLISWLDEETHALAFSEEVLNPSVSIMDDEVSTQPRTDTDLSYALVMNNDIDYELWSYFGTNSGTTNDTLTYGSEIYLKTIAEEFDETITTV